jgi:hypothetical protein
LEELNGILRLVSEDTVELVTTPFNAMFNLVGEVSHRAHRDRFFWRVLNIFVTQSLVRNNHLGVCLSSKGSRFEKRLREPDAFVVYVVSSFDIVDSINNKVKARPKFFVEDVLGCWSYKNRERFSVKIVVHVFGNFARGLRLWFSNVFLAEKELTVQI